MKKRIIEWIMTVVIIISSLTAAYSAFWLYRTPTNQLVTISQPLENASITKETDDTPGAEYSSGIEVSSPEQLEAFRKDTSKPLYLKYYLSIPALRINTQVFEGTSDRVLTYGAGTIKPGQKPNAYGNYAVAAHNFADWTYGRGFSLLQSQPQVHGKKAYLSDGEYVYTYVLANYAQVFRDDSMKFTEDDWAEQVFEPLIKRYAPEELRKTVKTKTEWNDDGSYRELDKAKSVEYGKLLTLYTCHVMPPNYNESLDRILVTGIQVKQEKLDDAPESVRKLFIIEETGQLGLTSEDSQQDALLKEAANEQDARQTEPAVVIERKEQLTEDYGIAAIAYLDSLIVKGLKQNVEFVNWLLYGSLGIVITITILSFFIGRRKE